MPKRWKITGYEGSRVIYEGWARGALSDREVVELLARLQARHLTEGEIVSASLRRGTKGRTTLLEVHAMNTGRSGFMTLGSPAHYVARYEEYEGD